VQDYKHVQRWTNAMLARPAVRRGHQLLDSIH
jgi:glutathione S-transferase